MQSKSIEVIFCSFCKRPAFFKLDEDVEIEKIKIYIGEEFTKEISVDDLRKTSSLRCPWCGSKVPIN